MSGLPASGEMPRTIAIDAHAHLRRCFELTSFLDHAAANFGRASDRPLLGILLLAETAGCVRFEDLAALPGDPSGAWVFERTGEPGSLLARHRSGTVLLLIAGWQVVTRERLEVLSLASVARIEDGLPIDAAIGAARDAGAIAVLPWGFGKWWGRRGEIVGRILESVRPGELFVGDNGNRPWPGLRPRLFRVAEGRGIQVLPGSDPLSLPDQIARIGRYGTVLSAPLDLERPAAGIEAILRSRTAPFARFGRREGIAGFLRAQLRVRWTRGENAGAPTQ